MKFDVDERADELALEIWNHLYRKTADLRPGYTEEFIRRMWLIAVTKGIGGDRGIDEAI